MTDTEAKGFIDNFLKEMFPMWKPTDWQLKQWFQGLLRCDYEGSKRGMQNWYTEASRPGREPILGIFNQVKKCEPIDREQYEPVKVFTLARPDNLDHR